MIAGLLVAAVRCFRARPLVDGPARRWRWCCSLARGRDAAAPAVRGQPATLHGPGGLLGQWMGEVAASFIGVVGAALAATTMLVVALLLVTRISCTR